MILLAALVALPMSVAASAVTDENVAERISTAKTAADHRAVTTYYRSKAAAAAAEVKRHEEMLGVYGSQAAPGWHAMKPHCQKLIDAATEEKAQFEHLAGLHEKLAKEDGHKGHNH